MDKKRDGLPSVLGEGRARARVCSKMEVDAQELPIVRSSQGPSPSSSARPTPGITIQNLWVRTSARPCSWGTGRCGGAASDLQAPASPSVGATSSRQESCRRRSARRGRTSEGPLPAAGGVAGIHKPAVVPARPEDGRRKLRRGAAHRESVAETGAKASEDDRRQPCIV